MALEEDELGPAEDVASADDDVADTERGNIGVVN